MRYFNITPDSDFWSCDRNYKYLAETPFFRKARIVSELFDFLPPVPRYALALASPRVSTDHPALHKT